MEIQKGEYEGISYTYRVIGSGEPLILIPGTLGDEELFSTLSIGDKFTFYTFDHLTNEDLSSMIEDYHKLFTGLLGLSSFHLGGSSVGGWISQHYAMRHPDDISSLIIGNSFAENNLLREQNLGLYKLMKYIPWFLIKRLFIKNMEKSMMRFERGEETGIYFKRSLGSLGKKGLRNRLSWSLTELEELKLPKEMKKLIIYTEDDSVISFEVTKNLLASYPEASVSVIKEGDHYPYRLNPEEIDSALANFLI